MNFCHKDFIRQLLTNGWHWASMASNPCAGDYSLSVTSSTQLADFFRIDFTSVTGESSDGWSVVS
eukprot:m.165981 g.165981  ORF g.165981 m.165981 type:complete len:65 (-) comp14694_c0_seq4:1219-1413(-)